MISFFPNLLALNALILFPLSGPAAPTLESRSVDRETYRVLRDGFSLARDSIQKIDPARTKLDLKYPKAPPVGTFMLFSSGQKSDDLTFYLVWVPPEGTEEEDILGGTVYGYKSVLNPKTGGLELPLSEMGTTGELDALPLNNLKAEGWIWQNNLFFSSVKGFQVRNNGHDPIGLQIYQNFLDQLRYAEILLPFG